MITLKDALKVANIGENEILRIKRKDREDEFLTRKNIVDRFDLKNTRVSRISPYFFYGKYEGFMFQLIEPAPRKNEKK